MKCETKGCGNEATRLGVVLPDQGLRLYNYRESNVCEDCFWGWGFLTKDECADARRVLNDHESRGEYDIQIWDKDGNEFVACGCDRVIRDHESNQYGNGVKCKPCRERELAKLKKLKGAV